MSMGNVYPAHAGSVLPQAVWHRGLNKFTTCIQTPLSAKRFHLFSGCLDVAEEISTWWKWRWGHQVQIKEKSLLNHVCSLSCIQYQGLAHCTGESFQYTDKTNVAVTKSLPNNNNNRK